jgi:hypothetical protein
MSEEIKMEALSDESLENVAGGVTAELKAAYAVIRGEYGNGTERQIKLTRAGYDPDLVQSLVNSIMAGNEKVARAVIDGKYGNGTAREKALRKAGYDPNAVQLLVNHILWK